MGHLSKMRWVEEELLGRYLMTNRQIGTFLRFCGDMEELLYFLRKFKPILRIEGEKIFLESTPLEYSLVILRDIATTSTPLTSYFAYFERASMNISWLLYGYKNDKGWKYHFFLLEGVLHDRRPDTK